jgi:hypothetical protein
MTTGSSMRQSASAITTWQGKTSCERTGPRSGAAGSTALTAISREDLGALLQSDPVALLAPSVASCIEKTLSDSYFVGAYGFEPIDGSVAYALIAAVPGADLENAVQLLQDASQPAPRKFVIEELARLRVTTARRNETDDDLKLMFAAYAEGLGNYPVDVVETVLRRRRHWWPSLEELQESADPLVRRRKSLLSALRHGYQSPSRARPEAHSAPTAEDKIAVDQMVEKCLASIRAKST